MLLLFMCVCNCKEKQGGDPQKKSRRIVEGKKRKKGEMKEGSEELQELGRKDRRAGNEREKKEREM